MFSKNIGFNLFSSSSDRDVKKYFFPILTRENEMYQIEAKKHQSKTINKRNNNNNSNNSNNNVEDDVLFLKVIETRRDVQQHKQPQQQQQQQ